MNKKRKEKKKCKNHGGYWARWRCELQFLGPLSSGLYWLSGIQCLLVDWAHGEDHLLAFRSMREATWRLGLWGVWCSTFGNLHKNALEKITWNYGGTWESNPGPSDHLPAPVPLDHLCAFVNKMRNKYNI